ncbi:hypothetical protein EB796_007195 [Bugula neritina]|uniref:Uncharacterized protein n=1 Tax=Bugula neritina TaxID=10212 RepID=A0A7J7K969_BUGNE|nr:hypothetical protein EB796_007195 [Bugula neritina]
MISESFLGLADNFYRLANASDAHISAKMRFPNMTSDWVNNLDNDSLYAAIGPARALLDKSKLNAVDVKDEISERLKTRVQERTNKHKLESCHDVLFTTPRHLLRSTTMALFRATTTTPLFMATTINNELFWEDFRNSFF